MKTIENNLKRLFVAVLIGLPTMTFASGDISVVAEEKSNEMNKIQVEIPSTMDLDISIIDYKGRLIYSETIEKNSRPALLYNLSNLENGEYTFVTKAGHQTVVKNVEVRDKKIEVLDKKTEFKPVFLVENNMLKINYLNKSLEDVKITLEDGSKLYYDKKMKADMNFQKAVDISNLNRGTYYVSLEAGDEQHTFNFDVF